MNLSKNIVALQKGFVVTPDNGCDNMDLVATTNARLMSLGYMLDKQAMDMLARSRRDHIIRFHNEVTSFLKNLIGDGNYQPIYKNFPQEVMNKTDIELFAGAVVHYMSKGTWVPPTVPYEKEMKFEDVKFNVLKHATEDRFNRIFTDLVSINTSLMPQDMAIIRWFVETNQMLFFPDVIPFKENLCTLAAMGIDVPIKTTTDVLRIATHMSGGDISLPKVPSKTVKRMVRYGYSSVTDTIDNPARESFKFRKFKRAERRKLLSMLEQTNCDASEMILKSERWVRLGEILHPGEYKNKYPRAYEAFQKVREKKVRSWYSRLDAGFKVSLSNGLLVLQERPGEFVRRIDWLVRTYPDNIDTIMTSLSVAAEKASNKVLFEVYEHFEKRKDSSTKRTIMVKGSRRPVELPELPEIPARTINNIQTQVNNILCSKFAKMDSLGVCYVDENLKRIPLPTNMRSLELTNKPVIRGQRTPIEMDNPKVIRAYVHWHDANGSEDLDLSATFVKSENDRPDVCSFSNPRIGDGILHSGDVRYRQGDCAEYIDVDIQYAIEQGYRYVVFDVRDFEERGLKYTKAKFGMMEREYPEANEIWLPDTVTRAQSLTSEAEGTLVGIVDLQTMEYIHLDVDSDGRTAFGSVKETQNIINIYAKPPKFSVYNLIMMHVEARGTLSSVNDENVETSFLTEDFMHSYEEIAKWMGI